MGRTLSDPQRGRSAIDFLVGATKFCGLMGSAILAGSGIYYSIRADIGEARREASMVGEEIRRVRNELAEHDHQFSHGSWFGSGVLHPALARCLEQLLDSREEREDERVHQRYRGDCLERWERFLELNPTLTKPNFR